MVQVTVAQAKAQFSSLLDAVEAGEAGVIPAAVNGANRPIPFCLVTGRITSYGSHQCGSHTAQPLEPLLALLGAVAPLQVDRHPAADR